MNVEVSITDENDCEPKIIGGTNFRIDENNPKNTRVTTLQIEDRDAGRNGKFTVSIVKSAAAGVEDNSRVFVVKDNKHLVALESFDREEKVNSK